MPLQEVVEAEGHLIDSHVMENIFDKVVEFHGRFEVDQFRIGRTNSEASYLRLKVEAPDEGSLDRLLEALLELGCAPVDAGDATLREVERDRCAPEDFYCTTNHRTSVRHGQKWIEVEDQRMDAMIVVRENRAFCRRLRDLRQGDCIVAGLRGIRVLPESKERDRLSFAFMSNGISSERQVETAVRQTAALVRQTIQLGQKVAVVAGPVALQSVLIRRNTTTKFRMRSWPKFGTVNLWWLISLVNGRGFTTKRSEEHTSELQSLRHLVCR